MKLNNKKIVVVLVFCFLGLVLAFSFQHGFNVISSRDLTTDSGFDSDFGGSSSSSSDYDSSGIGSIDFNGFEKTAIVIALIVSIFVIFPILVFREKKKGKVDYPDLFFGSLLYGIFVYFALLLLYIVFMVIHLIITNDDPVFSVVMLSIFAVCILIIYLCLKIIFKNKKIDEEGNDYFEEVLDDPRIVKEAYDIYVKVQEAWSKNNIENVRSLLTSEMFNMYNTQKKTMIRKKERNVMSDFKFVKGCIHKHENIDGQEKYVVTLQILCKDYLINDKKNKVIKGSKKKINDYTYSLTFVKDKEVDIDKCPNCQGDLSNYGKSVKCPYCDSVIERKTTNLVLVDKKMIVQK